VAAKAAGYGMPGVVVDGNDLLEVYAAARAALERARAGKGPTLLECKTYRFKPHSNADDDRKYRSAAELEAWRQKDPIARLETYMLEHGLLTAAELSDCRAAIAIEIEQATELAEQTPFPAPETLHDHVYGSLQV